MGGGQSSLRQTTYSLGPFIRYYFLPIEKQLNIFAEGGDEFGSSKAAGYPSESSNTYFVSAGPAFLFNEHVALEFSVGYSNTRYHTSISSTFSTLQIGFGLQIHLRKGNN